MTNHISLTMIVRNESATLDRCLSSVRDLVDEIIAVSDGDAYATARSLAREEGLFAGISSGANVLAAIQVARELGPGHRVATVAVDSGLKYLAGDLFT